MIIGAGLLSANPNELLQSVDIEKNFLSVNDGAKMEAALKR